MSKLTPGATAAPNAWIAAGSLVRDPRAVSNFALAINMASEYVHVANIDAGWWTDLKTGDVAERNVGEILMLIVSEIAEAMEAHRKGLMDDKLPDRSGLEVELADAIIRILDLAGAMRLDLGGAIKKKLAFNRTRADHQIENRKAPGGKAY